MKTYAAYYDDKIRENSSSGGVFSLIADLFDVIYGVAMTNDYYGCKYIRTENDISKLRGSKYIQAKIGDTYKQVKKDLIEGKKVLFTGTGCLINGLYLFLGREYQNLFLLEIICHGVPSPKLWREYIHYQEKKIGKINRVSFRDKTEGWLDFGMKENELYISMHEDSFMQMFLRDYCLRPSCYKCEAKKYKKADITIGDFWGIETVIPELFDNKGTSLIIIRTEKGMRCFDLIKGKLVFKDVDYNEAVKYNSAEYKSVEKPKLRNTFFKDLNKIPFSKMEKKYAAPIITPIWKKLLRGAIRRINKSYRGG